MTRRKTEDMTERIVLECDVTGDQFMKNKKGKYMDLRAVMPVSDELKEVESGHVKREHIEEALDMEEIPSSSDVMVILKGSSSKGSTGSAGLPGSYTFDIEGCLGVKIRTKAGTMPRSKVIPSDYNKMIVGVCRTAVELAEGKTGDGPALHVP